MNWKKSALALAMYCVSSSFAFADHDNADPATKFIMPDDYYTSDGKTINKKYRKLRHSDFKFILSVERTDSTGQTQLYSGNHFLTKQQCLQWANDAASIDPEKVISALCIPLETILMEMEDEG